MLGPWRIASDAQSSLAQNSRSKWNVVRFLVRMGSPRFSNRCRCRFVANVGVLLAARFPPNQIKSTFFFASGAFLFAITLYYNRYMVTSLVFPSHR